MDTVVIATTPRLVIRHLRPDDPADVDMIFRLLNSEPWRVNIADLGIATHDDARAYIVRRPVAMYQAFGFGSFALEARDGGARIGIAGLIRREELAPDVDLGFAVLPEFHRQGFAEEACRAIVAWARDTLRLPKLAAITSADNAASVALLEGKLGFRRRDVQPTLWGKPQLILDLELATAEPPS